MVAPEVKEVLDTFRVAAELGGDSLGAYVIPMASNKDARLAVTSVLGKAGPGGIVNQPPLEFCPGSATAPEKGRVLDEVLVSAVSAAKDADESLCVIGERTNRSSGVVGCGDCCLILSAAVARGNAELALSIFYAMRSSFDSEVGENGNFVERWKWSRPDVNTYTVLIQSLASSMRVSDTLKIISSVCRVGVSPSEEVPFGKVVRCPSCMVAVAVAQPQHGIQTVSCSKCRYQYELVSGTISSIESEEIRISCYRTQHGYPSMEEGAEDFADCEAKFSSRGSLCCG